MLPSFSQQRARRRVPHIGSDQTEEAALKPDGAIEDGVVAPDHFIKNGDQRLIDQPRRSLPDTVADEESFQVGGSLGLVGERLTELRQIEAGEDNRQIPAREHGSAGSAEIAMVVAILSMPERVPMNS
jgi:hypothetical protein